jgi:hypothetical protein
LADAVNSNRHGGPGAEGMTAARREESRPVTTRPPDMRENGGRMMSAFRKNGYRRNGYRSPPPGDMQRVDLAIGHGSEHQAFVVRIDASIRSTSKDSLLDDRS